MPNPITRIKKIWSAFSTAEQQRIARGFARGVSSDLTGVKNAAQLLGSRPTHQDYQAVKILGGEKTFAVYCEDYAKKNQNMAHPLLQKLKIEIPQDDKKKPYDACTQFQQSIEKLEKKIQEGAISNPIAVYDYLYEKKASLLENLQKIKETEIAHLKQQFEDNNFKQELTQLLSIGQKDIPKVQDEFVAALTKRLDDERNTIEKAMNDQLRDISQKFSRDRVSEVYFRTMYENAEYFKAEEMKKIIQDKQGMQEDVDLATQEPTMSFDGLTLEDCGKALVTTTGLPITLEKVPVKNENGVEETKVNLKIALRSGPSGKFYDPQHDIRSLMMAARVAGIEPIEISIRHESVEYDEQKGKILTGGQGLHLARLAYCEALRAGYKPEDIRIKINGLPENEHEDKKEIKKFYTENDLFRNDPTGMLARAQEAARHRVDDIDKARNMQSIKSEVQEIKKSLGEVPLVPENQDRNMVNN